MKYSLSIIVIILFSVIIFLSCSDDPTSIGIDLLDGDYLIVSTFDTKDDTVTQTSSFFKDSSKIRQRRTGNRKSNPLIRMIEKK